ncbi:post-GPI attachment to proteins factor 2-like isoform X1 [Pomacea canaliculata]|uniref:post-GPI attachment to proteins factor 2-like isoform X1 n=1 Tax=Pomacea canaliculata TaxID=400727 RepID=UPI000D72A6B7|nr:post-GPI attachment to proteins factor 2-like isoform X1 [Pomacea canaliculata]XP_025088696.1 post-GPI attachment to proteins factor 2-like isoform X1 [Pomacea canaliculata]
MGGNRFAYFSLPVSKIVLGTCSLPMFATIFCVVWSVAFDFERSTATHCKVYNFLPSISSAIGGFAPQRYVWRICVSIHCTQRFMVGVAYYNFHTSVYPGATNKKYKALAALNSLLHLVEIFSLVCLSMISSTENGGVHEGFFISFIISGLLYMLVTIVLLHWGRFSNGKIPTTQERMSLSYKTRLFLFKIFVFAVAAYLFYRHNAYCEPYVYSWFAALEYVVVFTNIFFHATLYWDLEDFNLALVHKDLISSHHS